MEFAIIKIKGQSFMLHQIRKMIGMTIAVVRGHASLEVIHQSWDALRIDIPRAPGLGLMLDEIHFERYNKRFANDGIHEGLTCSDAVNEEIESFKDDFIFPEMIQARKNIRCLIGSKSCLNIHLLKDTLKIVNRMMNLYGKQPF